VQISSRARARPTIAGSRTGPPAPGNPPQSASGSAKPDVARQRQLGRARACGAVERRDDDLGERLDPIVEAVGDADQLEDLLFGVTRPDRGIQDAHREELGAASRDHDRLDLLVGAQTIDQALQCQQDVARESVLIGRPVEHDRHRATVPLDPDFLRPSCHRHLPVTRQLVIPILQ